MIGPVRSLELGSPDVMQSAVQEARFSILEIGAGAFPDTIVAPGEVHVGHNIDPRQHSAYTSRLEELRPSTINMGKMFALIFDFRVFGFDDLDSSDPNFRTHQERLDELFGDTRFDQLLFRNVFGERDSKLHYRSSNDINPTGADYWGRSDVRNKYNTLAVATRYLKQGGSLFIEEYLTPEEGYANNLQVNASGFLGPLGYSVTSLICTGRGEIDPSASAFELSAIKL